MQESAFQQLGSILMARIYNGKSRQFIFAD